MALAVNVKETLPNSTREGLADKDGFIRVGAQPINEHPHAHTTLMPDIEALVRVSVRGNLLLVDSKLPGNESIPKRTEDIQQDSHKRVVSCGRDRVKMVCD